MFYFPVRVWWFSGFRFFGRLFCGFRYISFIPFFFFVAYTNANENDADGMMFAYIILNSYTITRARIHHPFRMHLQIRVHFESKGAH